MFKSCGNCIAKWCFKKKSIRRRKDMQWNRRHILLQKKWQSAVQSPEKYYFSVLNRQSSKRITAYRWHTKNESMKNVIANVAPKNKTMAHRTSLNNMILCVVGISIFGFKTYRKQVFNLMEIQTTQTLEELLQAETLKVEKKKSYYQRYDVKRLRAFHKQAMMKQQIYKNMLARRSGIDYSPGIHFQTSLINMEEAKELTMRNQTKDINKSGAGVAPSSTYKFPPRISLWDLQLERPKIWPWGWGHINPRQRRQQMMQHQRRRKNVWRQRPMGRVKNKQLR